MNGTGDSGREDAPLPPPKRDRTTLWAVGGAVVLFIVIVAAALMIEDEPREEGAPQPSPKSRRADQSPVEAFNAALRRGKRRAKGLETVLGPGASGAPVTAEVVEELEVLLADLDEVLEVAPRLRLTSEERDLLVQSFTIARETMSGIRDTMAQAVASGETADQAMQRFLPVLMNVMPRMTSLRQHPAAGTLLRSLEKIGVETKLTEGFLPTAPGGRTGVGRPPPDDWGPGETPPDIDFPSLTPISGPYPPWLDSPTPWLMEEPPLS